MNMLSLRETGGEVSNNNNNDDSHPPSSVVAFTSYIDIITSFSTDKLILEVKISVHGSSVEGYIQTDETLKTNHVA